MGFDVRHEVIAGGAEGLCTRLAGRDVIFINPEGRSVRRQRFTLAHELGHSLLGHSGSCRPHQVHGHTKQPEEAAANQFAAALLMPPSIFRADIRGIHPRMSELSSLADDYGVSTTAAALRFVRFTDDHCAVLGVTPEATWLFKSRPVEPWWIRNPPPDGSLIRDVLSLLTSGDTTIAEVDGKLWIENLKWQTSCQIREEIAPAGPDSWLVVLSELPHPDDDPDIDDREAEEALERRRMSFRLH